MLWVLKSILAVVLVEKTIWSDFSDFISFVVLRYDKILLIEEFLDDTTDSFASEFFKVFVNLNLKQHV